MSIEIPVPSERHVSMVQRVQIITMLLSGEPCTEMEVAKVAGVDVSVVRNMLANDPEIRQARDDARREIIQQVEKSAINLALSGRNEIAKQKAQEMLLSKLAPETYGSQSAVTHKMKTSKKIILKLQLEEEAIDENGIPVAQSKSPLDG